MKNDSDGPLATSAHGPHDLPDVRLARDAILLDVDGTLLDIAPTPDQVCVPDSLRAALVRLEQKSGGAVALISGRTLENLDQLFAPLRLPAAGSHGAELRPRAEARPFEAPHLPPTVRAAFADVTTHIPGLRVEDKGFTLAFHYRNMLEREAEVVEAVTQRMDKVPDNFEMLRGKAIIEIKPKTFNKGTALRGLMAHPPFAGRRPIFHGDDVTDEDVFAALPEFGGIGVSVGRHIEGAQYCVATPHDIRTWLLHLAEKG